MTKQLLVIALLLVAPDCVVADTPAAPRPDCGEMSMQTDMNICFANEAEQSEQLLGALLHELNANLDSQQRKDLASVQAIWVKYRRDHCDWQAAFFDGGSVQPTIRSTCYQSLTRQRIDELKTDLCEGAGMTAGGL